ncbi:MAG: SGNH/GDSL hydrolase family protein [Anaerolineales bacterium]|nr:MAG: SGNH/GDSL hydrolase family protein [Anaerolineales bacterium]
MLFLCITALGWALTACGSSSPALATPTSRVPTGSPVVEPTLSKVPETSLASPTSTLETRPTATMILPSPTPDLDAWQQAPIVPPISTRARQIFEQGLAQGNDPRRFSKIGDSETFTSWFLAPFDQTPATYRLGEHASLQAVIDHFSGSYARQSVAARQGFNAASVFAPLWADPVLCLAGETPLACEFRIHQPSYVFVLLGTNDIWHVEDFEDQMRRIIQYAIEQGVLPILGTKADNLEGDGMINRTLYTLALEYDIPLWNFWAAVQDLPQTGLDEDQAHLTFGYNYFDDPEAMQHAWPVRNLTALQVLDAVWRATQP